MESSSSRCKLGGAIAALILLPLSLCQASEVSHGCVDARACVELAIAAMGGREKLEGIKGARLDVISNTQLAEQSYRQAPFITSYERDTITLDFVKQRVLESRHAIWPESDPHQAESDTLLIVVPEGGVYRDGGKDSPCSGADLDEARQTLALGPARLLLAATKAPDLRLAAQETLRSTSHFVVAFTWNTIPVRILINQSNHLPDAVQSTQQFKDFWYFWGDVTQRVLFDNWKVFSGIVYPTNQIIERNGLSWSSTQVLDLEWNVPIDEKQLTVDTTVARRSTELKGWNHPLGTAGATTLASGVDLYEGSWSATVVKQPDGVVILETPISGTFTKSLFAQAHGKYPSSPIKAVIITSDSWPHVGGIRFDVDQGTPLYILDLNRPLLERMIAAPHSIDPDELQASRRKPAWRIVSDKTEVGSGDNRLELYPLRGASTERQMMVYFPAHHLLYASDTLVLNPDNTLYDPELMREVVAAVEREHLTVSTVYAMHQAPLPWEQVVALVHKAVS